MNKGKMILDILVEIRPDEIVRFDSPLGNVTMIPFGGRVEGEIFNGIVEPCGVDTQISNQAQVRHMSARYTLTGKDNTGADCHIYVENNAWFTNGEMPKPFTTVPTFITDSKALAPYLHQNAFIGEGIRFEDGLHIRFYEM